MATITSTNIDFLALREARGLVARHHIECEADYYALGMNPWKLYEEHKRRLARDMATADPPLTEFAAAWGAACRELTEALRI